MSTKIGTRGSKLALKQVDIVVEELGISDYEVVIIKNNIYLNSKFVDKFKDDIISALYQKKKKKIVILSESTLAIYLFEDIDGELEINDIISIENTKKIKYLGLSLSEDIVFLKKDMFIILETCCHSLTKIME